MALKQIAGKVVKKTGDKSISVVVERKVKHPRYHKYVKRFHKYIVHDEQNEAKMGDVVKAIECTPFSKSKSFTLLKITKKGVE